MNRGPYVQTLSGRHWYFTDPRPEDVYFDDLRALSRVTRYGGHTADGVELYSVMEHSVRVARLLASWGAPREVQLAGLLHDGGEAYPPGDQLGPLVRWLEQTDRYNIVLRIRAYAQIAVNLRFGVADVLTGPLAWTVAAADRVLLATERRDLCEESAVDWGPMPNALPERIEPWTQARASGEFQRLFRDLGGVA